MKTLIRVGSARKDGHSALIASQLVSHLEAEVIHLSDFAISDYNYDNIYPVEDQFVSFKERLITFDQLLLVTPVYWYSMSSLMKRFLDRLTDLITVRKELGYQLKSMILGAIACGSKKVPVIGFDTPFKLSAEYLGIGYLGFLHTYVVDGIVEEDINSDIRSYFQKLT